MSDVPGQDTRPALLWSWTTAADSNTELSAFRFPLSAFYASDRDRPNVASFAAACAKPGVVSFPLPKLAIKTKSFYFAAPGHDPVPKPDAAQPAAKPAAAPPAASPADALKLTRIHPPGDVIKLADRLYYVLQPPLEAMIRGEALEFPFQPYPYQFEGVAFLYPRYAAILADEMGLGKTMQAITAIRLLLHSGEVRSVLLVCPKPLVTNWQREFHQLGARSAADHDRRGSR